MNLVVAYFVGAFGTLALIFGCLWVGDWSAGVILKWADVRTERTRAAKWDVERCPDFAMTLAGNFRCEKYKGHLGDHASLIASWDN